MEALNTYTALGIDQDNRIHSDSKGEVEREGKG